MALLKLKSTGKNIAGGITSDTHAIEVTEKIGVDIADVEVIYTLNEIIAQRRLSYNKQTDYLSIDYVANIAQYGIESEQALAAKDNWLKQRNEIKTQYPKPVVTS